MTGANHRGGIDEQDWWKEQIREEAPRRQLRLIARNARQIYERAGTVLEVVRASAPLDPEIAATWDQISSQRLERSRTTARRLISRAGKERIGFGLDELAVTFWSLTGPELYTMHVGSGRSADQNERSLGDVLERTILRGRLRPRLRPR